MKDRRYIPKTTDELVNARCCIWCIHRNKCINAYRFESKLCLSFQKSAGIKKRIKKKIKRDKTKYLFKENR